MLRALVIVFILAGWIAPARSAPNESTHPNGKNLESAEATLKEKQIAGNTLDRKSLQEIYGGVVVDQTITVVGQNFYQMFVSVWRDKPNQDQFSIAIREKPSARWGNEIWVEYAQRRVFQATLPPNSSNIRAIADLAVEIAYKNVVNTEVQRLLFRDPDIGPDEL